MIATTEKPIPLPTLAPLRSARRKCLECCCGSASEVRICQISDCGLHPYGMGRKPDLKPALSVLKSIRTKCMDCSAYSESVVRDCTIRGCPSWPHRMGRNPNRAGLGGSGNTDGLAGESSADEVHLSQVCWVEFGNVIVPPDIRPMLLQHPHAIRVVLHLPLDLHSGPLQAEVEAANTTE